jgi:hypothetical protein
VRGAIDAVVGRWARVSQGDWARGVEVAVVGQWTRGAGCTLGQGCVRGVAGLVRVKLHPR